MNRWNRIFHGKHVKALYYLRCVGRYLTPRAWCRWRRKRLLRDWERRPDRDYILDRVDYYCKLQPPPARYDGLEPLAAHRWRPGVKSVYFFDTYEYTRCFDDRLRWHHLVGDITYVPELPSITKSRPVAGDNARSVLLNIDKVRHFTFLRDDIPFRAKRDRAIFKLAIRDKPHRERFMRMHFGSPLCDASIIPPVDPSWPSEWLTPKISLYDHLVYKFILAIEGNDVATNLKWIMSSNSVAVMPRPTCETWFMEGRLRPGYHYIEIRPDFSDLEERLRYYIAHPDEAEAIVRHAHEWVAQFRDRRRERIISLLVMEKYFRMTGQRV